MIIDTDKLKLAIDNYFLEQPPTLENIDKDFDYENLILDIEELAQEFLNKPTK